MHGSFLTAISDLGSWGGIEVRGGGNQDIKKIKAQVFDVLQQMDAGVCKKKNTKCYKAVYFIALLPGKLDLDTCIFLTNLQRKT